MTGNVSPSKGSGAAHQPSKAAIRIMKKKLSSKEFIIGICVLISIAILICGIDYLKGVNLFKPANFYYVSYDNVAGLETAAPVTVDGFKVGQVRDIEYDYEHHGKIKVLLALDKKLRLPDDSYAEIGSSLLGGSFINLRLGKSTHMIERGGDIRAAQSPDLMAAVTEELVPSIEAILPRVDTLLYNLNRLVADPKLAQSIHRLDGITDNVLVATDGLRTSMTTQVPAILGNAGRISHNLDTVTSNLGTLSYQLKMLPIATTMDNVNQVAANLQQFSDQLNNKNSTLGRLMYDRELYDRISVISADLDSLIVDIKRNPKRYISIKLL